MAKVRAEKPKKPNLPSAAAKRQMAPSRSKVYRRPNEFLEFNRPEFKQAVASYNDGQTAEAYELFLAIARKGKAGFYTYDYMASCCIDLGDPVRALGHIAQIEQDKLMANPFQESRVGNLKAICMAALGNLSKAEEIWAGLLRSNLGIPAILYNYAQCRFVLGKADEDETALYIIKSLEGEWSLDQLEVRYADLSSDPALQIFVARPDVKRAMEEVKQKLDQNNIQISGPKMSPLDEKERKPAALTVTINSHWKDVADRLAEHNEIPLAAVIENAIKMYCDKQVQADPALLDELNGSRGFYEFLQSQFSTSWEGEVK